MGTRTQQEFDAPDLLRPLNNTPKFSCFLDCWCNPKKETNNEEYKRANSEIEKSKEAQSLPAQSQNQNENRRIHFQNNAKRIEISASSTMSKDGVSRAQYYGQFGPLPPQPQSPTKTTRRRKKLQKWALWIQSPSASVRLSPKSTQSLSSSRKNKSKRASARFRRPPEARSSLGDDNDSKDYKSVQLPRQSSKESRRASSKTATTCQSLETHHTDSSMMMMLEKYSFMSYRFPMTKATEKLLFRKQPNSRDIAIEASGEMIGFIDYSLEKEHGIRIVKDITGRHCAIIQKTQKDAFLGGPLIFQVYGDKASTFGQNPSYDDKVMVNGCYLWAEIKNKGSMMGGKFVMKRYSLETSSCFDDPHCATPFGLFRSKTKGYTIMDNKEKECVKMISLDKNRNKGILIAPNRDMCLMLAFCAVVDEMVENMLI